MSDETLKQHVVAMQRGARCSICPLYGCGQGPVMPEVRLGALLTIIGEAPGTTEVEEGRTFAGATSEVLTATLPEVGVSRQDCTYTNAILCRPPGGHMLDFAAELNKKHKKEVAKARAERVEPPPLITPQECCAPRLEQDIADSESRVLLALGSEGLKAAAHAMKLPYAGQKAAPGAARVTSIKKQHGSPVLAPDGRVLMSSLHPVFAGYGNNAKYMPVIREDLKRAGRIAKRGAVIDWYEPEFIIKPSHDTCINVMERMRTARALVTVDIETDGKDPNTCNIRCVGLGAVIDGHEVVIVIPLRHMDGRRWWSPADEQRIENALRELLESNPLAGQNLLFDTCVLLRLKLLITRGKRWFDCYLDEETEFLTSRGWRKYDDVRKEDQLATIAPDNTLEWQRYETRVDKQRQGHLLQLETQHTRAVVTPKHTVWHQKTKRDGTQLTRWQLTPAEQLLTEPGGDANVLRACRPALGAAEDAVTFDGVVLDAARLKLLGLAVGDGTLRFHDGRPYRLRVSQKVGGRAYAFLQKFTAWATSERQYEKREVWRKAPCTESMWEVVGSFAETVAQAFTTWFGRYSVERRLPSWAFTLPLALRRALFEGLLLGDASEVRGATLFRSGSRQLADDVHALAVTLGIVSTLHRSGKCWVVSLHSAVSNEVQVVTRETKDSVNGFASRRPDASYRVVCFVVPNHTLVTRSGGRPAFHGNTMLAHHNTSQSELPHDLGFIAARNFEAPRWKEDADAKSIDGVDDFWLHLYCCKDVLGEMRLVDPLARQVNEEGTALALKTDTLLAPTARDMGVLGLNIDEDRRRKFFDILDAKVSDQATKLKLITGNPDFNPNAFKQVADFLYIKKGLSPPYATDGREWEELEDDEELEIDTDDPEVILAKAATNELALLRLLELGVDEQTRQFIEGELFYRGLQKCKSTYVGLKAEDENGARVIVDTHRKKGYLQTEFWLGKRHSILHPSWKLHITPTGRWATSPNVQNWPERIVFDIELYKATERIRAAETAEFGKPRTPEAGILNTRAMVVAPDEHILVGADYAAIELRLYAAMSGDALLLDAIQHGKDPHALNYATMQSRHPGDLMKWYDRVMTSPATVKKYLRIIAKRFGFLVIYGGQKDKLYRTMASDRNPDGTRSFPDLKPGDVEMWFDNWHRAHPETKRWHEAVVRAWSRHGFVATILDGRRRFFLGGMDMTAMPNMTIQGSAASIANRAMIRVAEQCPHRGWSDLSGPVLQVHDFIGLQVPLKRQKEAEALLMREMPYEYNGMKYEVEQKSGLSWDKT